MRTPVTLRCSRCLKSFDLPLRIGILIDTSNSIRDRFRFQQEAATEFINTVIRPGRDKGMVVSFDSSAELVADLTDSTEVLGKAIRGLRPGGGTALYDAVVASADHLKKSARREKKVLLVVTLPSFAVIVTVLVPDLPEVGLKESE